MNEQIVEIERENRAFWLRMLRKRFGRDVSLEIDWDSFQADSAEHGWQLYPLNIQQAGIERLLYAISGLMDTDDEFKEAAVDNIHTIHISSAADIRAARLLFHRGRISSRCFAGDWNGYFAIEQIRSYLKDSVPGKSRIRKRLEGWLGSLFIDRKREVPPMQLVSPGAPDKTAAPDVTEEKLEAIEKASGAQSEQSPKRTIEPYDSALRTELESVYEAFLEALRNKDLERLMKSAEVTRTDEETLRREMENDGFVSFSDWLLTTHPRLEQASFIALKTKEDDLAGYYLAWRPPYTREYLNLTLIRYLKISGKWKIVFRLTEMASAPFRTRTDERPLDKALEVLDTSPLLVLERPEPCDALEKPATEPKLTEKKTRLKEELENVLATIHRSLQTKNVEAFLSAVVVSQPDGTKLRKKFKKLSGEILGHTPDPSQAIFVALKTKGSKAAGYYFVAPYPPNPAFRFVYLRPFVRRDARWQMIFSLDHELAVSLNIAKSGDDIVSRAKEVITEIDLLHLDWAMTALFDDIIREVAT